ncbi:MAG: NAD(P)H-dependent glycerol-3-phosphate dehydrogenase [Rickettsiaceae bacterium]|nr:NAD(P)H-dependent glycerol-3-phosphate dehydrogenase [Rickettsiaceae bacterium]
MKNIQIIGSGAWGLALATVFSKTNKVELITRSDERMKELARMDLSENINFTSRMDTTPDYTIISTTANAVFETIAQNHQYFQKIPNIIIASKGMDPASSDFLSNVLERFGLEPLVLGGPNYASELMLDKKAASNIGAKNIKKAQEAAKLLSTENFVIKPIKDYISLQICGCYKNIISIYSGYIMAKGYGQNYRSQKCTEGILELMNICKNFGRDPYDVLSYGGIGDIMLSSYSEESRNFRFGASLVTQNPLQENLSIEGISSARLLYKKCKIFGFEPPLLAEVNAIIDSNSSR